MTKFCARNFYLEGNKRIEDVTFLILNIKKKGANNNKQDSKLSCEI